MQVRVRDRVRVRVRVRRARLCKRRLELRDGQRPARVLVELVREQVRLGEG